MFRPFRRHFRGLLSLRRMRFAALSLAFATASALAVTSADPVDDYIRAEMKIRRIPGLSLAVVKDGKLVKAEGYGVASLELEAAATRDTVYEIGSISKQIAANAILLLVEDGKVRLDDPVSSYLDNPPKTWAPITIRHL